MSDTDFREFLTVLRRALAMLVAWIDKKLTTK